jgi:hypothetical protein
VSPVKANGEPISEPYTCQWRWNDNTDPIETEKSSSIKIDASAVL